ncbi:MAG: type II toxin-antitoxin system VapC family toxin [Jatrophihabitantaceae bacterium]
MTAFVDTSVLIDYLRGHEGAAAVLENERAAAPLQASEITRLEVLAGMRPAEEDATRSLLSALAWHPVDAEVAEDAGALGRRWLPGHHTIDGADLAIAATVIRTGCHLLTRNVRHFPMFADLRAPY